MKVILLVRDPRGFMYSRSKISWCAWPTCKDPVTACKHLQQDLKAAYQMEKDFPGRIHLMRQA